GLERAEPHIGVPPSQVASGEEAQCVGQGRQRIGHDLAGVGACVRRVLRMGWVVGEEAIGHQCTVTVPLVPSTVTVAPSGMRRVPSVTETTHGIPSSRDTMTAWLICAPTSTTTAPAGPNSGVHD